MKTVCLFTVLLICSHCYSQDISQRLNKAMTSLEDDNQFSNAIISMYVVDAKTGNTVYRKNEKFGLAPASCQKVVTSCAAFEILGKNFRYKTYVGKDEGNNSGADCVFITGDGDPTLGSWRWNGTTDTIVFSRITDILKKRQLLSFGGDLIIVDDKYGMMPLPDGWVWQDIGNYYGAGCYGLNWHENQFDLVLQPGSKVGDPATVKVVKPSLNDLDIINNIKTGKPGSGDNGYIYSAPFSMNIITQGTVPMQPGPFTISGSIPTPAAVFKNSLFAYLNSHGVKIKGSSYSVLISSMFNNPVHTETTVLDSVLSPSLDSINYWFLKKSVNLYGEAFVRSIAWKKAMTGSTDTGTAVIRSFWESKGISKASLNIIDGSGLSPANRVTTEALVKIMQYARQQSWFSSFYDALPEMNGIKMKDGYIGGVRSYTGYIKSSSGAEYTFSFIVNNFNGNPGTVREKIWKLLDILK